MPEIRRKRILVVDDDADVLLSLRRLVERMVPDMEFIGAASAREALALLPKQRIDLIISDFRMPDVDGLEFLEQSRRIAPESLTVMLTAYPSPKIAQDAVRRGGVVLLVTKPFDPEAFVSVIRSLTTEEPE